MQAFAGASLVADALVKLAGGMHLLAILSELAINAVGWVLVILPQPSAIIQARIKQTDGWIAEANRAAGPPRRLHSDHWGRAESASTMGGQIAGSEL